MRAVIESDNRIATVAEATLLGLFSLRNLTASAIVVDQVQRGQNAKGTIKFVIALVSIYFRHSTLLRTADD